MAKSNSRIGSTITFGILLTITSVISFIIGYMLYAMIDITSRTSSSGQEAVGLAAAIIILLPVFLVICLIGGVVNFGIGIPGLVVSIKNVKGTDNKVIKVFNIIYIVLSSLAIFVVIASFVFIFSGGLASVSEAIKESSSSTELALLQLHL